MFLTGRNASIAAEDVSSDFAAVSSTDLVSLLGATSAASGVALRTLDPVRTGLAFLSGNLTAMTTGLGPDIDVASVVNGAASVGNSLSVLSLSLSRADTAIGAVPNTPSALLTVPPLVQRLASSEVIANVAAVEQTLSTMASLVNDALSSSTSVGRQAALLSVAANLTTLVSFYSSQTPGIVRSIGESATSLGFLHSFAQGVSSNACGEAATSVVLVANSSLDVLQRSVALSAQLTALGASLPAALASLPALVQSAAILNASAEELFTATPKFMGNWSLLIERGVADFAGAVAALADLVPRHADHFSSRVVGSMAVAMKAATRYVLLPVQ